MGEVRLSRTIPAPPEVVFSILADPDQYRKLNSGNMLIRYDHIERTPDGGFSMDWRYSALGFPVRLRTYTTDLIPARRFAAVTEGQVDARMSLDLSPTESGTHIDLLVEYLMGKGILASITDAFAANQMRYSMETLLDNLHRAAGSAV